jgi:hypothetical protein
MIRKKSSVGLSRLLWTTSDICKVSDGMRVVGKCLRNILIPCFGAGYVWGWINIPKPCAFSRAQEIFSTERIVALRSVNKIFPESYDFTAKHPHIAVKQGISVVQPQFIISSTFGGATTTFGGSVTGIMHLVRSSRSHPYSAGSKAGGSESRADFQMAV